MEERMVGSRADALFMLPDARAIRNSFLGQAREGTEQRVFNEKLLMLNSAYHCVSMEGVEQTAHHVSREGVAK